MGNKIRFRSFLLRDVQAGFSFGKPDTGNQQTPDPAPAAGTGPENIRAGAIGGAHYYEVRNIIQIPFDDSIDATHDLECFFQMPTGVLKISKAQVWVQKKPFRMYSSAASSSSSGGGGAHGHNLGSGSGLTQPESPAHSHAQGNGSNTGFETGHTHTNGTESATHVHPDGDGVTITGSENTTHTHAGNAGTNHQHALAATQTAAHQHSYIIANGTTDNDFPVHTHTITTTTTLTPGIFESGGTGNLTLYLSDNGSTYGASITGPSASDLSAVDVTSQLTTTSGDKRLKIHGDALMRVQVLLVLDLLVSVDPIQIGIP